MVCFVSFWALLPHLPNVSPQGSPLSLNRVNCDRPARLLNYLPSLNFTKPQIRHNFPLKYYVYMSNNGIHPPLLMKHGFQTLLASVVSLDLFCVLFVFLFALRFTSSSTISFSPNGKKTEISTWLRYSFSPFSPLPLLSVSPLIHSIYPFIHLSIHLYSK